jgi:hypothetical protein
MDHTTIIVVRIAIISFVLVISLTDLALLLRYGPDATYSRVIRKWGEKWILFPYLVAFAMGALFGHFFLCPQ